MNINDINNKIYGAKELNNGNYTNYILNSIDSQIINNGVNLNLYKFKDIDYKTQIKF